MRKFLLAGLLFLGAAQLWADYERFEAPRSSFITTNTGEGITISTTQNFHLDFYQVLSTGASSSATFNIYDGSVSSTSAIKKYEGFPTNNFFSNYPLDINTSSGVMVVNQSSGARVRLVYHFISNH